MEANGDPDFEFALLARRKAPKIFDVLQELNLEHIVIAIREHNLRIHEASKAIEREVKPKENIIIGLNEPVLLAVHLDFFFFFL